MRSRIFAALLCVPAVACLLPSLDGLSGSRAAADAGFPPEAGGGCGETHGPAMVRVPQGYCIDSTEVTNAQYKDFVLNGDPTKQTGSCAWNVASPRGFKPESYLWYDGHTGIDDNAPVQGPNFCDAKAYCAWAGKRLCGKIGGGPLPSPAAPLVKTENSDPQDGQWYAACAHGAARQVYPYGDVYKPGACNIGKIANPLPYGAVPVASFPACVGGYPGIFDMTGNVHEWIDLCDVDGPDPALTNCLLQGGPWNFDQKSALCAFAEPAPRNTKDGPQIGFRCCKD